MDFFNIIYLILAAALWPWGRQKLVPEILLWVKGQAGNLNAICEPIVYRKYGSLDI
jgi:hypothetical protein